MQYWRKRDWKTPWRTRSSTASICEVLTGQLGAWPWSLVVLCDGHTYFSKITLQRVGPTRTGCHKTCIISSQIFCLVLVQFSSVDQSCLTLCDPMNHSTPGLPVHHQLPESTQTHVHRVGDAIQPSHPLSSPSPPAPNPSQH